MPGSENKLKEATGALFARYGSILAEQEPDPSDTDPRLSLENLAWMCREAQAGLHELPLDKLSRWLGFVQGCLAMRGLIDVDEERDISRPMFHAGYAKDGAVPKVRERS